MFPSPGKKIYPVKFPISPIEGEFTPSPFIATWKTLNPLWLTLHMMIKKSPTYMLLKVP